MMFGNFTDRGLLNAEDFPVPEGSPRDSRDFVPPKENHPRSWPIGERDGAWG
jgi:hypothetical protein